MAAVILRRLFASEFPEFYSVVSKQYLGRTKTFRQHTVRCMRHGMCSVRHVNATTGTNASIEVMCGAQCVHTHCCRV